MSSLYDFLVSAIIIEVKFLWTIIKSCQNAQNIVHLTFIQTQNEAKLEVEELKDWCRQRLANYKIPKTFEFVEVLPTLPIGKIDKQSLRKRLSNG